MKKILVGLLLLLGACDSAARQSATVVVNAVIRFRTADLAGTPAAVEALRATPCTEESCPTKQACLAAGDSIAQGLRIKGEVEQMIPKAERKELAPDSIEVLTMPSRLEQADALLKKGFDALPACDESMQGLKRKHRL